MKLSTLLKPSEAEIESLALRETDVENWKQFLPFTHGPIFAILAMAAVLLLAWPHIVVRLIRRIMILSKHD